MISLNKYSTWLDVLRFAGGWGDKSWTYIILGRSGPTGKTFLYNMLKKNGYNAIEISEDIWDLVNFLDAENHYRIDYLKKQVTIVLNKPLQLENDPILLHRYDLYKRSWCEARGHKLEDMDEETGINGECYACFDEWYKNEYQEMKGE